MKATDTGDNILSLLRSCKKKKATSSYIRVFSLTFLFTKNLTLQATYHQSIQRVPLLATGILNMI